MCAARGRQLTEQTVRNLRHLLPGDTHDADAAAPGWRGRSGNRVRLGQERDFASAAAIRRLMFHCCRIPSTVLATQ